MLKTIYVITVSDDTDTEVFGNKAYHSIKDAQKIVEIWESQMGNTVKWEGYNQTVGKVPERPDYDYLINKLTLDD